jgi:hypothetical protein
MEGDAMRGIWAVSLGVLFALMTADVRAQEVNGQPGLPGPAAQSDSGALSGPASAVSLGRPMPLTAAQASGSTAAPAADAQVMQVGYGPAATLDPPQPVVRGQSPDWPPPSPPPGVAPPVGAPPPPPPGAIPVGPSDPYNCGVVTQPPPPASNGFLGGVNNFFSKVQNAIGGNGSSGRSWFQSDHCFDNFASPVTNPFLFEDPRSLTEFRPIFMYQGTPLSNITFHGGDIEYAGIQGRVALTEQWSIVMTELGSVWMEPHKTYNGFHTHEGLSELRIGPKYTFFRCENTGTVAAAGLNFDIPIGSKDVFQDTGTLSLEPYISVAQNFGRSSYGSFNVMNTTGYSVATDNQRTDFLFTSLHLDYDVVNTHKYYPFIEMNDFYITAAGKALPDIGFEGRDLFNFGARGTSGNNTFTMATGLRYKYNEHLQAGAAYEFPLGGHRDLLDYRLTFDIIFRY